MSAILQGTFDPSTNTGAVNGSTFTATEKYLAPDGSTGAPAISFTNDPDCGFYRSGANQIELVVNGGQRMQFTNTFAATFVPLLVQDGSAVAPSYGSYNYSHGMYFVSGGVNWTIAGTLRVSLTATAWTSTVPIIIPTQTPATAGAAGVAGTVVWDADFIYVCTATNTWKRAAIATW